MSARSEERHRSPHLRLPAQRARIRGDARARGRGRAGWRDPGQHLRGHRRSRAPGAPGDPQGAARASAMRRSSSPAALPRSTRRASPRCRRSISSSAMTRSCTRRATALPASSARARRVRVNDIMSVRETAGHLIDGLAAAYPRLRRGAERLRPPLHLLHHPLRSRAIRARCRWAPSSSRSRSWSRTAMREVVLTGVDITAYGADLPGRAQPRQARPRHPPPRARAQAPPPLLDRLRSRSTTR